MKAIGLDIGTTTISGSAVDLATGQLLHGVTQPNTAALPGKRPWQSLQDPAAIHTACVIILEELLAACPDIAAIGITGQMHGILYVDEKGKALGPLITWQDGRGDRIMNGDETYAQAMGRATGMPAATGFGTVTLLYDSASGIVPHGAASICTIGDYIAMTICGNEAPRLHASNAAGLGGYDLRTRRFTHRLPSLVGRQFLPGVLEGEEIIGTYRDMPVCCAVGDNQASAFGSLGPGMSLLVNIGTGSQVSAVSDVPVNYENGLECRPYVDGKYLSVGAALCGGWAYKLLGEFFTETAACMGALPPKDLFQQMDAWAEQASDSPPLTVDTRFRGTRTDPALRGSIQGIGPDNFTPGSLCLGVLEGICGELHQLSRGFDPAPKAGTPFAAGGGGVRASQLTRRILARRFGAEPLVPSIKEAAAFGAALIAAAAAGTITFEQASGLVAYD